MKIKENFVLQKIADEYFVVPIAEESDRLHGVIRLNETGAFLWDHLTRGIDSKDELEGLLLNEYNVNKEKAHDDVNIFIDQLESFGCLNH